MNKKLFALLSILVIASMSLAACGGGAATEAPVAAPAATEAPAAAEASVASMGGAVEVFSWWTGGGEAAGLEAMQGVFAAANPDIEFINAAVAGGAGTNARAV
ncbi:MAG: hypothetical protein Q8O48_08335, partial [Anaerolineales bacterium]|nr:hypothetical protein [Anaerolineales bacterium]